MVQHVRYHPGPLCRHGDACRKGLSLNERLLLYGDFAECALNARVVPSHRGVQTRVGTADCGVCNIDVRGAGTGIYSVARNRREADCRNLGMVLKADGSMVPLEVGNSQRGGYVLRLTSHRQRRGYICLARTRRAPGIQINVLAIYPNTLPPNITPSSSPGYLAPAVSGAHAWTEWLHHHCLLGGPQHGDKKRGKGGRNGGK